MPILMDWRLWSLDTFMCPRLVKCSKFFRILVIYVANSNFFSESTEVQTLGELRMS